jgi:hypothetical protein
MDNYKKSVYLTIFEGTSKETFCNDLKKPDSERWFSLFSFIA